MKNSMGKVSVSQLWMMLILWGISLPGTDTTPTIYSFDKVAELYEGTVTNKVLSTINCSDPDLDVTNTLVTGVTPSGSNCAGCFTILDCAPFECLTYRAGVGTLSYSNTQSYLVTVTCTDNLDPAATEVIQVKVTPNSPPYFNLNGLFVDNPPISSAPGTLVYQVDASDDDLGDKITYSLTVRPTSSSGSYQIDSATGKITTTVDLRTECRAYDTLSVTISDGTNTVGPLVVNVPFLTPNTAPVGINLDTEVHIPEDTINTAYKMIFQDAENNRLTYSVSTNNNAGLQQFTISPNSPNIDIASALDYENSPLRQTDLVVSAFDGFCSSPSYTLRLKVTDVNEEPHIQPEDSSIEVCEGKSEFDPGYKLTDPDIVDTVTWSLVRNPSKEGAFDINPVTGALRTLLDYDVDNLVPNNPQKFIVQATDKGGLSATATVTVTFLDCNDNAPVMIQTSYEQAASECTAGGTVLGSISATDEDSSREQNNVLYYRGSGGSVSVGTGGEIIVNQPQPAGTVVTFRAYAYDRGQTPGPLRSQAPAVVSVRFTPCPTTPPPVTAAPVTAAPATTTTTTTTTTFTREPGDPNLPWIIIAALLGTFMLGLLSFMLWRYGALCARACTNIDCGKSCKGRPPRVRDRPYRDVRRSPIQKEPESRPPTEPKPEEPPAPGFLFGFWKERYPNDDFKDQPNRATMPRPGDMDNHYPHTIDPVEPPSQPQPDAAPAKNKTCIVM